MEQSVNLPWGQWGPPDEGQMWQSEHLELLAFVACTTREGTSSTKATESIQAIQAIQAIPSLNDGDDGNSLRLPE